MFQVGLRIIPSAPFMARGVRTKVKAKKSPSVRLLENLVSEYNVETLENDGQIDIELRDACSVISLS